jgi:iron complex transport system ATP-binding protein
MTAALQLRDLVVGYKHAVAGPVSLTLATGQALAVLGPNGCGKTTLLRTCLGLLPSIAGSVECGGAPLPESPIQRARVMAYVPQMARLAAGYSVRQAVALGRSMHIGWAGKLAASDEVAIDKALTATDLLTHADTDVERLSGGEQQRVLIARALATGARLLLLDEPFNHLDLAQQARTSALLAALKGEGYAIAFTTHSPNDALALSDHALLLRRGTPPRFGLAAETLTPEALSQLFGVAVREKVGFSSRD